MKIDATNNKIITSTADVELVENDLLTIDYHNIKGTVEFDQVSENYEAAKSICDSKKTRILIITSKDMLLSKDAREDILNELKNWRKIAVVVHGLGQKIMANFILSKFIGPPFKAFSSKKGALEWLNRGN